MLAPSLRSHRALHGSLHAIRDHAVGRLLTTGQAGLLQSLAGEDAPFGNGCRCRDNIATIGSIPERAMPKTIKATRNSVKV